MSQGRTRLAGDGPWSDPSGHVHSYQRVRVPQNRRSCHGRHPPLERVDFANAIFDYIEVSHDTRQLKPRHADADRR